MKRAMAPFEQGIQNCSKMILTYLMQVRNWWCACLLTSLMGWRIKMDSYWQEMVGQVVKAFEEGSIKQLQTDQIYKAYWKTWYLWKFKRVWEQRWLLYIWDLSREQYLSICQFWSDKWHNRRSWLATGRSQLLVQYCIILDHLSFLGSKEEGIQEFWCFVHLCRWLC